MARNYADYCSSYRAWHFTWIVNTDVTAKAASASMATQNWQASFRLL